eukprot:PhF_6_TR27962/c0_g2_i1/m.41298
MFRVPNLKRLYMDWSVFDSKIDLVGLAQATPKLEVLSLTGVRQQPLLLWNTDEIEQALGVWTRLQVLHVGSTDIVSLGVGTQQLTSLRVLDGSRSDRLVLTHPVRLPALRCLVVGASMGIQNNDFFPNVEYIDIQHTGIGGGGVFGVTASQVFPKLRRVCLAWNDTAALARCVQWLGSGSSSSSSRCVADDVCRNDEEVCGLPRFPVLPGVRTWGEAVMAYMPQDATAQCNVCGSGCYNDSVMGYQPPVTVTIPPTPTTGDTLETCIRLTQSVAKPEAVCGSLLLPTTTTSTTATMYWTPSINLTQRQAGVGETLSMLNTYASVITPSCAQSIRNMTCWLAYPRCTRLSGTQQQQQQGIVSSVCVDVCTVARKECASILSYMDASLQSYFQCDKARMLNRSIMAYSSKAC